MSIAAYLRSKIVSLIVVLLGIGFACLIAAVCGCPSDAVALMAGTLALCSAGACAIDYMRTRSFYQNLKELSDTLEHPYQLHSLISEPVAPDQLIVFEALKTMGSTSADEVARAQAKADEHREFVEGWVHGIKAPLAASTLIAGRVNEPERSQLGSELDKVQHKVDAALWYARSDCALRDYAIREVALADIARTTCRDNARFLIEQGCMPHIDIDDSLTVFTDKKQAVFIIAQLVENAAKYGAHNVQLTAEQHGSESGSGHIALMVQDDGRGIPAEDVGRVFERGFTGTRGREGTASTGMGLYLAARLCEQLGLGLSITSVDGEGTCATISFPLDRRQFDIKSDSDVSLV